MKITWEKQDVVHGRELFLENSSRDYYISIGDSQAPKLYMICDDSGASGHMSAEEMAAYLNNLGFIPSEMRNFFNA